MIVPRRAFFAGVFSRTGALDSQRSRDARTLDSLTGTKGVGAWRTGIFEGCFESSTGDGAGDFFAFRSHHVGMADNEADQIDDALVLVDLTEEESETGDDAPEDVIEYVGLSGRIDDSEIQ